MNIHVTLAIVMSADAKITKWHNPRIYDWTSEEDRYHFSSLKEQATCIIMGSKTYTAAKDIIRLSPGKLRIIMSGNPEKYVAAVVPGQLEFHAGSPEQILQLLEKRGYTQVLLAGGGAINAAFLKKKLVNDLLVTIEPCLFGKGHSITGNIKLDVALRLEKSTILNKQGTLLLHYKVI